MYFLIMCNSIENIIICVNFNTTINIPTKNINTNYIPGLKKKIKKF